MQIARPPRSTAASLLLVLVALIALVSGPSAAVQAADEPGWAPRIEGLSPHGDDATTRTTNRLTSCPDNLTCVGTGQSRWAPLFAHEICEITVASDAVPSKRAVAASPGSGRSPPPVGFGL